MPRNYKRKAPQRALISDDQIKKAKHLIEQGASKRRAAEEVGISEGALRKRLKSTNVPTSLGRFKPTFTKDEEAEFAVHCQDMDDRYFGITINDLRRLAYEFATENNIKHRFDESSKMAGRDWVACFLKRHPHLSIRQSAPISLARAIGFNKTQVQRFYTMLKEVYDSHNFRAHRIYNMDETGMSTVPKKTPKVVSVKGKKVVGKVVSAERGTTITAIMCMSATGHFIPPAFIYPRKRVRPELMDGGPTQSICMVSDSGYVNTKLFVEWLRHFKDFVHPSKEDPVLLILDNHSSHITLEGSSYAREHHIVMLTLPPHGSHKLQPLDVALHGPLKTKYSIECEKWMNQHPGRGITQYQVASLFNNAFKHVATIGNAESGFRATGIFPFADDLFDETDFAPSSVTDQYQGEPSGTNNDIPSSILENDQNNPINVETIEPMISGEVSPPASLPVFEDPIIINESNMENNEGDPINAYTNELVRNREVLSPLSPTIFTMAYSADADRAVDSDATNIGSDIDDSSVLDLEKETISSQSSSIPQNKTSDDSGSNKENKRDSQVSESKAIPSKKVSVAELSPLPRMVNKKTKTRVSLRSELITSSPYKAQLEEKKKLEEEKRSKISRKVTKRVVFEPQPGPSGVNNKLKKNPVQAQFKEKKNKKAPKQKSKGKRNESVFCPICDEKYEDPPIEDWIQCIACNRWFHEHCTAYEGGIYRCDFCD